MKTKLVDTIEEACIHSKENTQFCLEICFLNFEDLTISSKHALALFSYPDGICLKINIKYSKSLNLINSEEDPLGKPYPYPKYLSKFIEGGDFSYEEEVEFISTEGSLAIGI